MLVIGLILVLLAVLAILLFVVGGANDPGALLIGTTFKWTPGSAVIFLAGAATLVVLVVGLLMLQVGLRRARQRRRDAKELERLQRERLQRQEGGAATGSETTRAGTDAAATSPSDATPAEGSAGGGAHRGEEPGDATPETRPGS
jgi:uncharacterized membrane protein